MCLYEDDHHHPRTSGGDDPLQPISVGGRYYGSASTGGWLVSDAGAMSALHEACRKYDAARRHLRKVSEPLRAGGPDLQFTGRGMVQFSRSELVITTAEPDTCSKVPKPRAQRVQIILNRSSPTIGTVHPLPRDYRVETQEDYMYLMRLTLVLQLRNLSRLITRIKTVTSSSLKKAPFFMLQAAERRLKTVSAVLNGDNNPGLNQRTGASTNEQQPTRRRRREE
jgi:hypothetical protein